MTTLNDKLMMNSSELASIFSISAARIGQLTADGILTAEKIPGIRGRMFDIKICIQNYIAYIQKRIDSKAGNSNERIAAARADREEMAARKASLELGVLEKQLHRAEDVAVVFNFTASMIKTRLLSFPATLADALTGKNDINEVKEIMRVEVYKLLELLATGFTMDEFYEAHPELAEDED